MTEVDVVKFDETVRLLLKLPNDVREEIIEDYLRGEIGPKDAP